MTSLRGLVPGCLVLAGALLGPTADATAATHPLVELARSSLRDLRSDLASARELLESELDALERDHTYGHVGTEAALHETVAIAARVVRGVADDVFTNTVQLRGQMTVQMAADETTDPAFVDQVWRRAQRRYDRALGRADRLLLKPLRSTLNELGERSLHEQDPMAFVVQAFGHGDRVARVPSPTSSLGPADLAAHSRVAFGLSVRRNDGQTFVVLAGEAAPVDALDIELLTTPTTTDVATGVPVEGPGVFHHVFPLGTMVPWPLGVATGGPAGSGEPLVVALRPMAVGTPAALLTASPPELRRTARRRRP